MGTLYVVATPLGNLKDITLRAIEVLETVDIIVCEDTRHSMKLLSSRGIHKQLLSCHGYNEAKTAERVVRELGDGKTLAYISDAGTPGISDPGSILVRRVRDAGHTVIPVPGPSAFSALVSVSGFPGKTIIFEGFLSPKSGRRRRRLGELLATGHSFMLYESPFRILKLLADIADLDSERQLLIGREMTKMHEEYVEGTAGSLLETLGARKEQKGEFAILVASGTQSDPGDDAETESC